MDGPGARVDGRSDRLIASGGGSASLPFALRSPGGEQGEIGALWSCMYVERAEH